MIDDSVFAELAELKPRLETMHQTLMPGGTLEDLDGWLEFVHRPTGLLRVDGVPVLVATLYGPSGAGKSTMFRLLTGLDVPAGAERRPTTYGCVVALPEDVHGKLDLQETFPGYAQVKELARADQLADPELPDGLLYVASYPVQHTDSAVALIADVPDINTIHQDNWHRAEQMLARSEVVVFVCGPETYSDDRTVHQFEHVCKVAGYVAFVFTKCTRREAEIKWEHLKEIVDQDLERVAVFHSEFSRSPSLDNIHPLFTEQALPDVLQGADALKIRMKSMEKQVRLALISLRKVAEQARDREKELSQKISRIEEACTVEAERIAEARQPVQEILEIILEKSAAKRSALMNTLLSPVTFLSKSLRGAFALVRKLLDKPTKDIKEREDMEREKLSDAAERLVDVLRVVDRETVRAETAKAAMNQFASEPPPPVATDWEAAIDAETNRWVDEHPTLLHVVAVLYDALLAAGGIAIGIDLTVSGGLLMSMGASTAVGAGMIGGSKLLSFLVDKLGLGRVLQAAHKAWLEQRREELAVHLLDHLAAPLLIDKLVAERDTLRGAKPEQCLEQVRGLEQRSAAPAA